MHAPALPFRRLLLVLWYVVYLRRDLKINPYAHNKVSNMSKIRKASLAQGVCDPDVVVKGSLHNLGYEIHWSPFWVHALQE